MELELKHLAAYPKGRSGIQVQLNDDGYREYYDIEHPHDLTSPYYIQSIDYENNVMQLARENGTSLDEVELGMVNLVLHPLSDLTKEIEHNGETFIPINELDGYHNFSTIRWGDIEHDPTRYPYTVVSKLYEWHFDTAGLIDAGLAVDINTINHKSE